MNRFLLVTETNAAGAEVSQYVQQYEPAEMADIFTVHELLWLSQGKVVERVWRGGKVYHADMMVAALKTIKAARRVK